MKIIIVGCGNVGETLARTLTEEGNNITVIDLSPEKVKSITEKYDCMGVVGNGATYTVLKEAGVNSAELLVAVTESDELNLLCCLVAKKTGKCRVIARVQSPEYSSEVSYLKDELGLAMVINPEHAAAEEIARVLRFPAANKIETFSRGRVELIKFRLPDNSPLVGLSVRELITKLKCNILVCTVERDDNAYIAKGDFVFAERDIISIIASPRAANAFFKKIEYRADSVGCALIVGASEITHYLCGILKREGISIKVIDPDLEKCEELSSSFEDITVIHGDGTEQDLLIEEGISSTDAFLSLSDNDEENILISLFGKSMGDGKIITKINRPEYEALTAKLDLDTAIYPKNITSDMITRYVRSMEGTKGSNVETLYNIIKGKVEATEFVIGKGSPVIDIPLSRLSLKSDCLISAILRGGKVIIPRGADMIQAGDSVVVVSKHLGVRDISEFLSDEVKTK